MSKDVIGTVLVVGGGIAGMQSALDLANSGYSITFIFLKNPRPSEGLCRNWTKPFPPMTAPCELSHRNWSRSAGT